MMRRVFYAYFCLSALLIGTSLYTGRRATSLTGEPHYLLTRTVVLVEKEVEADNETDAELDELFEEAGESPTMTVEEPMFVLGLLDATGPAVLGGGVILAIWTLLRHRSRQKPALGIEPPQ